mmetsp:Transcript_9208/g.30462  ORF Transcript_9208/g.30462 Transcript_9208/m.30462 type:complete len:219 (-) Transcript_9208:623-1279(-)
MLCWVCGSAPTILDPTQQSAEVPVPVGMVLSIRSSLHLGSGASPWLYRVGVGGGAWLGVSAICSRRGARSTHRGALLSLEVAGPAPTQPLGPRAHASGHAVAAIGGGVARHNPVRGRGGAGGWLDSAAAAATRPDRARPCPSLGGCRQSFLLLTILWRAGQGRRGGPARVDAGSAQGDLDLLQGDEGPLLQRDKSVAGGLCIAAVGVPLLCAPPLQRP